jgi:NAD+ synthase (glutamine-hydrolysing)
MLRNRRMRVALLQLNLTVGALEKNRMALVSATARARELGAEIAVASELSLLGYPPRDLLEKPVFVDEVLTQTRALIDSLPEGIALAFGTLDDRRQGQGRPLYNSLVVAERGRVLGRAHKRLLPTYDVFDEDRYFEPGERSISLPWRGAALGLSICEDAWNDSAELAFRAYGPGGYAQAGGRQARYHANPIGDLLSSGIDILINASATPFTLPKRTARPAMFAEIARRHGVPLVFVNQVGGNDELIFDGRSTVFGPTGDVLARAAPFVEDVLVCDVATGGAVAPDFASDEEAAYGALVLGTRDYARKCRFDRAVLGLSGGIDSALTAAIAADALGPSNVLGLAMPSRYSSEGSKGDARALADNLGIGFREVPIESMFDPYLAALGPMLDELSPASERDVTFENVQARIRGTILMAASNRTGALLLTTGNKSELGVGYCTLYGDMAGGLAVISDVPKTMVYRLARYVNRDGIRIPQASLDKPPSAELRPGQVDQDSLPPYDLLDRVLERFVEDGASVEEIVAQGIPRDVVERVTHLVQTSEYKRRQAAPGLILSKKAFGVGRRMPIAQGFKE